MLEIPKYKVELRINGTLIGDVRKLAQDLTWVRRRTKVGVDEIDFTLNDMLFDEWCRERNTTLATLLKPYALDCRIVRNGVPIVGGYLATVPQYQPNGTSANLSMKFDGYMNFLAGVYHYPTGTENGRMGALIENWITMADERAADAGKAFGFTSGNIDIMPVVEYTFDNYKTIKDAIAERSDNISGAGPFDVYFRADRTYDIYRDDNFGDIITAYTIQYPTKLNGVSATSISAAEVSGFASTVIGIGAGEVSSNEAENTAITSVQTNSEAVAEYGYCETTLQESSISVQQTLDNNVEAELANVSNPIWTPQTVLSGRQIEPTPTGDKKIWIGDTVALNNTEDLTGQTSGSFRVNELSVSVGATGAETITPTWERVA